MSHAEIIGAIAGLVTIAGSIVVALGWLFKQSGDIKEQARVSNERYLVVQGEINEIREKVDRTDDFMNANLIVLNKTIGEINGKQDMVVMAVNRLEERKAS